MKGRPVIVAIMPDIPKPVLETGVEHAKAMGSTIVFAYVATDRVSSPSNPDASYPLDPTAQQTSMETARSAIHSALDVFMSDYPDADWDLVYLSGLPDQQLAHLAHTINAGCFILGTRRPGFRAGLQEWLDGSVAVQLGRRQLRPVIIVPLRSDDWEYPLCSS
ncbi:universal stress protein [Cutibacterium porci]|nr:universal stress protein [Cutibacterium porci]